MTTGQVTIHNAPRDLDKLTVLGPFMLKTLMQTGTKELGVEWTDEQKQAFIRDPINKRAEDVLSLLNQLDAKGPSQATQATPPPQQAAPAQQAAKREPVTTQAPATTTKTNGVGAHPVADGMAVLAHISEVLKDVSESQKGIAQMLGEVNKTLKENASTKKEIGALSAQMTQLFRLQHLTLGVLAQMSEQALGAPFKDILEQVASDYGTIEPLVQNLVQGK